MFRFTRQSGRRPRTSSLRARRPRSFVTSLEAVEDRTLMSALTYWTLRKEDQVYPAGFDG